MGKFNRFFGIVRVVGPNVPDDDDDDWDIKSPGKPPKFRMVPGIGDPSFVGNQNGLRVQVKTFAPSWGLKAVQDWIDVNKGGTWLGNAIHWRVECFELDVSDHC